MSGIWGRSKPGAVLALVRAPDQGGAAGAGGSPSHSARMAQPSLGAPEAAARPGGRLNTPQSPDRWPRSTPPANLRLAPGRSPVPPPGRLPPPRALCPAPPGSAGQQRPRKAIGRRTAAGPSTGQGRAGVPRKAVEGARPTRRGRRRRFPGPRGSGARAGLPEPEATAPAPGPPDN